MGLPALQNHLVRVKNVCMSSVTVSEVCACCLQHPFLQPQCECCMLDALRNCCSDSMNTRKNLKLEYVLIRTMIPADSPIIASLMPRSSMTAKHRILLACNAAHFDRDRQHIHINDNLYLIVAPLAFPSLLCST